MPDLIPDIPALARYLGAATPTARSIASRVYKMTDSGCAAGLSTSPASEGDAPRTIFWVCGYCEGSDVELPLRRVHLPATPAEVDALIEQADEDACAEWDRTHGCEECSPDDPDNTHVNPDCPGCGGDGIIL